MTHTNYIRRPHHPRHHAVGFSLLEVLISLVILSVGLLGIAGLMGTTVKSNDSAYMRTQATTLAYNIIDRMRANLPAVTSGDYDVTMPASAATGSNPTTCTGTVCSSVDLATYDQGQWEHDLATVLPQGRGSITTASSATSANPAAVTTVTVTVLWNDSRAHDSLQKSAVPVATTFSLAVSSALQ
ncbi:MAG: type IV pilus modification protein PilV [Gammaproteobacteria bacterium]